MIFLDTCLILYEIQKGNLKDLEEFILNKPVYITSFNLEELEHVEKKFGHQKHLIKQVIKILQVKNVDVHPGNPEREREFVEKVSTELLQKIHDPSDAVLIAAAIKEGADVITRDKHHLFTSVLENELSKYGIKVFNSLDKYQDS